MHCKMLSGLSVSFVVPTDVIGLLIGKSGTFFQETTKVTGTKLYLQSTADMPDLCRERILILVGEKKNVLSAIKSLFKRININRKSSSLEDIVLEKWVIKQADCGHLIGKYGDGIKKINAFSGAWVKVAHVEEYVSESSERLVYVRGTRTQTRMALDMIKNKVGGHELTSSPSSGKVQKAAPAKFLVMPVAAIQAVVFNGEDVDFLVFNRAVVQGSRVIIDLDFSIGPIHAKVHVTGPDACCKEATAVLMGRLSLWQSLDSKEDHGSDSKAEVESVSLIASEVSATPKNPESDLASPVDDEASLTSSFDGSSRCDWLYSDGSSRLEYGVKLLVREEAVDWLLQVSDKHGNNIIGGIKRRTSCLISILPMDESSISKKEPVRKVAIVGPSLQAFSNAFILLLEFIDHAAPQVFPCIPIQQPVAVKRNPDGSLERASAASSATLDSVSSKGAAETQPNYSGYADFAADQMTVSSSNSISSMGSSDACYQYHSSPESFSHLQPLQPQSAVHMSALAPVGPMVAGLPLVPALPSLPVMQTIPSVVTAAAVAPTMVSCARGEGEGSFSFPTADHAGATGGQYLKISGLTPLQHDQHNHQAQQVHNHQAQQVHVYHYHHQQQQQQHVGQQHVGQQHFGQQHFGQQPYSGQEFLSQEYQLGQEEQNKCSQQQFFMAEQQQHYFVDPQQLQYVHVDPRNVSYISLQSSSHLSQQQPLQPAPHHHQLSVQWPLSQHMYLTPQVPHNGIAMTPTSSIQTMFVASVRSSTGLATATSTAATATSGSGMFSSPGPGSDPAATAAATALQCHGGASVDHSSGGGGSGSGSGGSSHRREWTRGAQPQRARGPRRGRFA